MEWRDAPGTYERQRFEIEQDAGTTRDDLKLRRGFEPRLELERPEDTFNPYDRKVVPGATPAEAHKGGKRDLKKLSEWLKLMKAMEERKKNGDSGAE